MDDGGAEGRGSWGGLQLQTFLGSLDVDALGLVNYVPEGVSVEEKEERGKKPFQIEAVPLFKALFQSQSALRSKERFLLVIIFLLHERATCQNVKCGTWDAE